MNITFRKLLFFFLVLLQTGLSAAAWAHPLRYDLQIIAADESKSTELIVEALRTRFPAATVARQIRKRSPAGKLPIYLAVGPEALRYLVKSGVNGPIISTFTSHKAFHTILDEAPGRAGTISAVYADPSPVQQFQLIRLIYRKPIKVGVILSSGNEQMGSVLRGAVTSRQADVTYETLGPGENISRVLTRLADVQVILATPDSAVYNAETIRTILVSSYRRNQAVIGFSAAIVRAGALASTFSGINDIVAQVDEMVREYETSGRLPEPQFPKFFVVTVNQDVARSLNVVIADEVLKFSREPGGSQQ